MRKKKTIPLIDNLVPIEKFRVKLSNSTQFHKFMLPKSVICLPNQTMLPDSVNILPTYRIRQCCLIGQSARTRFFFVVNICTGAHSHRQRLSSIVNCIHIFDYEYEMHHNKIIGHMSQTGPKKCFIPQNCEKYTNFDWTEYSM